MAPPPPGTGTNRHWLGPYPIDVPDFWAEATTSQREKMHVLKTVMARNVTFDAVCALGGGAAAADGYLGAGLNQFKDGVPRLSKATHLGQAFRGVRIDQSAKLGPGAFIEYYTTLFGADMLGFSLGIFGPMADEELDSLRTLMFTLVYSGIVKSGVKPESAPTVDPSRELDLDNFPSGDDPF
jgi:hypothetical protein